ncbi:uncharacterized protein LOC135373022 isoform X2 [Ornithodoros turicata]|uniref:uncharacterized protein LOC135373022 isoform X2 n=1 Tax=Ornithodoros turicata TaxID=34597 RepID=UPI0031398E29
MFHVNSILWLVSSLPLHVQIWKLVNWKIPRFRQTTLRYRTSSLPTYQIFMVVKAAPSPQQQARMRTRFFTLTSRPDAGPKQNNPVMDQEEAENTTAIRRSMHKDICISGFSRASRNERMEAVKRWLEDAPHLTKWISPDDGHSALYRAVKNRLFDVYAFLCFRKCTFKDDEEAKCLSDLNEYERLVLRRQKRHFVTPVGGSHILYVKSKTRQHEIDMDADKIMDKIYRDLDSLELVCPLLKACVDARYMEIGFTSLGQGVGNITGSACRCLMGLTEFDLEKIYVSLEKGENEARGTLAHELCHMVMYRIYQNGGKPYRNNDNERATLYTRVLRCTEEKVKQIVASSDEEKILADIFINAFSEKGKEQQELIARIPHIIAYCQNEGNGVTFLKKWARDLLKYYQDKVVPDISKYIESLDHGKDAEEIERENRRLGKVPQIETMKVQFIRAINIETFPDAPLLILKGPNLPLLEALVHDCLQFARALSLFLETDKWSKNVEQLLLSRLCEFVVLTDVTKLNVREPLQSLFPLVVGPTRIMLLTGESETESIKKAASVVGFPESDIHVETVREASMQNVDSQYKKTILKNSAVVLQSGKDISDLLGEENVASYMDESSFAAFCRDRQIVIGPQVPHLPAHVRECYIERHITRAAVVDMKKARPRPNETFVILGEEDTLRNVFAHSGDPMPEHAMVKNEQYVYTRDRADCEELLLRENVVHVFRYDRTNRHFVWEKSNDALGHVTMKNRMDYTEETLSNVPQNTVVVCGKPGIGKTVSSHRLCEQFKKHHYQVWVLHIDLPSVTELLRNMNVKNVKTEQLAELCKVKRHGMEYRLFCDCVKVGAPLQIVLILDALDELPKDCLEKALDLTRYLESTKVHKTFLFSRGSLKSKIQDHLHTIAFVMTPFDEDDIETYKCIVRRLITRKRTEKMSKGSGDACTPTSGVCLVEENPRLLRMTLEIEEGMALDEDHDQILQHLRAQLHNTSYCPTRMLWEYVYQLCSREKKREHISSKYWTLTVHNAQLS